MAEYNIPYHERIGDQINSEHSETLPNQLNTKKDCNSYYLRDSVDF